MALDWRPVIFGLAVASMVLGNLVALTQKSVKRMLAYSSVAHAGYLLAALWSATPLGVAALNFYLLGYGVTSIAAFALLGAIGRDGERDTTITDLAGLGEQRPWMALSLTICMLSLLGFPGTIGFMGKWFILSSLVSEHQAMLAVILVVTSVVSAGYYMPVILSMYMRPARAPRVFVDARLPATAGLAVLVAVLLVIVLGVWPVPALHLASDAATSLAQSAGQTVAGN